MTLIQRLHWPLVLGLLTAAPAALQAASEGGANGGEADSPPLLNVDPGMYFWQIVLFLALFAVLAKFVWPPILKTLQDREEKMRDDLKQAEEANKQAQQTLDQYKQQLAEAQKESQRIIEQARDEAQQLKSQLKEETNQELTQMRQRAEQEIGTAKEQAISDIYDQTATLATQVAGRILQRQISEQDQKELVEQSLREIEQSKA